MLVNVYTIMLIIYWFNITVRLSVRKKACKKVKMRWFLTGGCGSGRIQLFWSDPDLSFKTGLNPDHIVKIWFHPDPV